MRARSLLFSLVVLTVLLLNFGLLTAKAEIVNMARGGDFETAADLNQWSFWQDAGTATFTVDEDEVAIGTSSAFMEIVKLSVPEPWAPGLTQLPFDIEKGVTYTFSAFLKAESSRNVVMVVRFHGAGGNDPRFLNEQMTVGTEWEEYWGTFTAQESSTPVGILFVNTGSDVSYWLDGVRFYEGEYEPTEPVGAVSAMNKVPTTWAAIKAQY